MLKKNLSYIIILVFLLVVIFATEFRLTSESNEKKAIAEKNQSKLTGSNIPVIANSISDKASIPKKQDEVCNKNNIWRITSDKAIRSLNIDDDAINLLIDKGYKDLNELIEVARKGNANAAIATFKILASCIPLGSSLASEKGDRYLSNNCPNFPQDMIDNRLELLDAAAKEGSSTAQIVFAMNAIPIANYYRSLGTNESVIYASSILKKSQEYGQAAASDGIEEAYSFMSRAYQTGMFGSIDPLLAYAYALPLKQKDQTGQLDSYLKSLKKRLSENDVVKANNLVFGCNFDEKSTKIANPFR
jgi:hypothetical protein